jgi:adenosylcobyric acid synthase
LVVTDSGEGEGVLGGAVAATHWHGLLENDEVRRGVLRWAAGLAGRGGFEVGEVSFAEVRAEQLDVMGDLVADCLDVGAVMGLIEGGAPVGLPFVPPGV